jgi:molybdopterin molybdotransferase
MARSTSLHEARGLVIAELTRARESGVGVGVGVGAGPRVQEVPLAQALGRVLAAPVHADRDQPPFHRSTRDGFAVRSADVVAAGSGGVTLAVLGEAAAGGSWSGTVGAGGCVEIMTGAPLPAGADAVVMVEHTERPAPERVVIGRTVAAGENVVARGSELAAGALAFPAGRVLDPAALGLLASLGCGRPRVFARPRVAVLSTGDELVGVDEAPSPSQIRDSNRHTLAAQILRAGGEVVPFPTVRDDLAALGTRLQEAVAAADVLLVSGGVSMGKYDHVEGALGKLGARVVFDAVDIRPGRPVVFGFVGGKPFFGLPGNPLSALVTFELLARPAIEIAGGRQEAGPLALLCARLRADYAQRKLPLTVFAPAVLEAPEPAGSPGPPGVRPVLSQGSGDLASLALADAFLVVEPGVTSLAAGTLVPVLPK